MRILISLGGNALGTERESLLKTAQTVADSVAERIAKGDEVLICHGNGPQVGIIKTSMDIGLKEANMPALPLSDAVAMSQSYIGSYLQNVLQNALYMRGVDKTVLTVVSRCLVDKDDEGFKTPTKPVGAFMTEDEARELSKKGKTVIEDSGRGWREVVASPVPQKVLESAAVKTLMDAGFVLIAGGGGGIPVTENNGQYSFVDAVIDKDFVSTLLAAQANCDVMVLLTGVEKVAIKFNTPEQTWLDTLTVSQAEEYIKAEEFAKGSMLPKIEAAVQFAKMNKKNIALITSLDKLSQGLENKTGTRIINDKGEI
ncbi:MAG: carbamate kinase [Eubacteriales bacterium]|nr:carbamate kinase [Eubacteriales bacterium]